MSDHSDSGDEEETIAATEGQTQMGTRTWSKPSLPDSLSHSQNYTRGKTQSPVQSGRGILVRMWSSQNLLAFRHYLLFI